MVALHVAYMASDGFLGLSFNQCLDLRHRPLVEVLEEVSLPSTVRLIEVVKIRGGVDGGEQGASECYRGAIGHGNVAIATHVLAKMRGDDELDSREAGMVL